MILRLQATSEPSNVAEALLVPLLLQFLQLIAEQLGRLFSVEGEDVRCSSESIAHQMGRVLHGVKNVTARLFIMGAQEVLLVVVLGDFEPRVSD